MDSELSELKLYEIIKRINSSIESLDMLGDLVLKASSDLDDLIRLHYKKEETCINKTAAGKT